MGKAPHIQRSAFEGPPEALVEQFTHRPVDPGALDVQIQTQLFLTRLVTHTKVVELGLWRSAGLAKTIRELEHLQPDEGLQRVLSLLRRTPELAPLEGGQLAIEVVPRGAPERTYILWQEGMDSQFAKKMLSVAGVDPTRIVQAQVPLRHSYDLRDIAFGQELWSSPIYRQLYASKIDSWITTPLLTTVKDTWQLVCWHQVGSPSYRLKLRSALDRLRPALIQALRALGVLPLSPHDLRAPKARKQFVHGAELTSAKGHKTPSKRHDTIEPYPTPHILTGTDQPKPLHIETLSLNELLIERDRIAATLAQIDEQILKHQPFSKAVPVRVFCGQAVSLIEGFSADPRPIVIHVAGTQRYCILRLPGSTPTTQDVPISTLGQRGSAVVKLVTQAGETNASLSPGVTGGTRIGIRRGGRRTGRIVAELCPPNDDSHRYMAFLKQTGRF